MIPLPDLDQTVESGVARQAGGISPLSIAQPALPVTGPRVNHIRAREHDLWRKSQLIDTLFTTSLVLSFALSTPRLCLGVNSNTTSTGADSTAACQ
jgi:hypothetical protein